jgi:hypothetical protein
MDIPKRHSPAAGIVHTRHREEIPIIRLYWPMEPHRMIKAGAETSPFIARLFDFWERSNHTIVW